MRKKFTSLVGTINNNGVKVLEFIEYKNKRYFYMVECPFKYKKCLQTWKTRSDTIKDLVGCLHCRHIKDKCKRGHDRTKENVDVINRCKKCVSMLSVKYISTKIKVNIYFKLETRLRNRIRQAIKTNAKSGSAVKDLGCSIEFFKNYITSMFKEGMSWDNWKRDIWHLDHIQPLASFDLTNREEFLKAVHYTNMQPLWALDNIRKGAKLYA